MPNMHRLECGDLVVLTVEAAAMACLCLAGTSWIRRCKKISKLALIVSVP
jgi:hypothetical protein